MTLFCRFSGSPTEILLQIVYRRLTADCCKERRRRRGGARAGARQAQKVGPAASLSPPPPRRHPHSALFTLLLHPNPSIHHGRRTCTSPVREIRSFEWRTGGRRALPPPPPPSPSLLLPARQPLTM